VTRLRQLALSWAANAIALFVIALVFEDVSYDGVGSLLLAAAVFGVLNTVVKPVLKLITLPLAVITLKLAWFAVSMLMLKVTDWLVDGFTIDGFLTLIWATIVVWLVDLVLDVVPGPWRGTRRD
jgi:putative membrane protein